MVLLDFLREVPWLVFSCRRAYSQGPGESVTRGDRRGRELGLRWPSPPLAGPRESDGASSVLRNAFPGP